jgi:hypothetical protein
MIEYAGLAVYKMFKYFFLDRQTASEKEWFKASKICYLYRRLPKSACWNFYPRAWRSGMHRVYSVYYYVSLYTIPVQQQINAS